MVTIGLGFAVGIASLIVRIVDHRKNKAAIDSILENNRMEISDFSRNILVFLMLCLIPSAFCLISGIIERNDTNIAFGILLVFLFLSECVNAKDAMKLYYNENGCIIHNKFLRYKSMKELKRKSPMPLSKVTLTTFNGERWTISLKAAEIIEQHSNLKMIHK